MQIQFCLQERKEAKKIGTALDFVKMEDEESNEPLSLADRLKLKGSPVDAIKGEKAKEVKKAAKKEPKGTEEKSTTKTSLYVLFYS